MTMEYVGGQYIQTGGGPDLHGPRRGSSGNMPTMLSPFVYRAHLKSAPNGEGWECIQIVVSVSRMRDLLQRIEDAGYEVRSGDMKTLYVGCSMEQAKVLVADWLDN